MPLTFSSLVSKVPYFAHKPALALTYIVGLPLVTVMLVKLWAGVIPSDAPKAMTINTSAEWSAISVLLISALTRLDLLKNFASSWASVIVSGSFVNPFSPFEFSKVSTKTSEFILFPLISVSLISAPAFKRSSSLIGGTSSIIGALTSSIIGAGTGPTEVITLAGATAGPTVSAVVTAGIGAGAGPTGAGPTGAGVAGAIEFAFGNLLMSNIFYPSF